MGSFPGSLSSLPVQMPLMFAGAAGAGAATVLALQSYAQSGFAQPATLALGSGALCLAGVMGWAARNAVFKPLAALREAAATMAEGATSSITASTRPDAIGGIARALSSIDRNGVEATRIRAALDACGTRIMLCDGQGRVVYVNKALLGFFGEAQEDFRAAFPGCSAKDMLGRVMEAVERDPSRQRAGKDGRRAVSLTLGRRTVALSLTQVVQADGTLLGTTVEWLERTDELAAAAEVAEMVAAAVDGDFSRRVPVAGKPDALVPIAEGLNRINGLVEEAVDAFATVLSGLAEGDLTQRMDGTYHGRLGDLQQALNGTLDRLSTTVSAIQGTAETVSHAAAEIDTGAKDLAGRTERTAVNLEETAATTEQLAASVKQSAAHSREASALAGQAMSMAHDGQSIVRHTVGAIERIETSSSRISDIVSVIDGIAFQTNLLALNAAVEAARAGDAGKGFAVVASEVRTLAQRSAQAAKDIKGLIASSNEQVGEGVRFVRSTGEALEKIVAAAGKVSATVTEISSATGEQARGIDAMSQAVAHMDETTQQNAAMAEQSASAAGELMGEIAALRQLTAFFRTGLPAGRAMAESVVIHAPAMRRAPQQHPEPAPARAAPRRRVAAGGRASEWAEY